MTRKGVFRFAVLLAFAFAVTIGVIRTAAAEEISILLATVSHDGHLVTEKGDKYYLIPDKTAIELGRFQGRQVIATGFIGRSGDQLTFTVASFQPVPEKKGDGDGDKGDE